MVDATAVLEATARSRVYGFLAQAFCEPDAATQDWLGRSLPAADTALAALGGNRSRQALAAVRDAFDCLLPEERKALHRQVFGHLVSGDCPPYEAEYGQAHIFQKSQTLADNVGFFHAFGLTTAPGLAERPDHISLELEFLHVLAAKEAYALIHDHDAQRLAIVRDATRRYLEEHLGRWVPTFAARLEARAGGGLYAALARLLAAFVAEETAAFDLAPAAIMPPAPPRHDEEAACVGCAAAEAFNPAMGEAP